MIVRVNVVLYRSCWQWLMFRQHQRLSGSHIQSQTALSIQQNWIPVRNFGNSMCTMERYIPVAHTWPKPQRVCLLFLPAGYKRAVLGTTSLSMERDISVRPTEMTRPVKVDHLQSWSRTFRSDQTWLVNEVAMLLVICQLSRDVNLVPRSLVDEPNQEIWVQDYRYIIGFEDSWCHWCVLIPLLSQFNSRLLLGCPVILSYLVLHDSDTQVKYTTKYTKYSWR